VLLLVLSVAFPLMLAWMPKIGVLPAAAGVAGIAGFSWENVLLVVWAAGFVVATGRLARAALVLRRWRKRSVEVGRVRGVVVCELQELRGPVAAGAWKPVVFVPASWREWPVESRRVVLEHELAHHLRRDPLWRLLVELACAVHWYHPLIRWMARRFIMQCEYACDAMVLGKGIDAKAYARTLCDFAEEHPHSPLALSMAETSSLESRVSRMLKPAQCLSWKTLILLGGVGLVSACMISMVGRKAGMDAPVPAVETRLRLTADPFPGEHQAH
jgi:beta-lactamase regulating signal transducer with metallopeptidase domain